MRRGLKRDESPTDIRTLDDIISVKQVLKNWRGAYPKRVIRVNITIYCTEFKNLTTDPEEVPQPQTQTKGRKSATTLQRLNLPTFMESEAAGGKHNKGCPNGSKTCFVEGSELPRNHYPIDGDS